MYEGDSFFTLALPARIGLVILSLCLAAGLVWAARYLAKRLTTLPKPIAIIYKLATAGALLWLFIWLSPQLYYLYFQLVLPDLPWQVVIGEPPAASHLLDIWAFRTNATIANHTLSVLAWALTGAVLWRTR